MSEKYVSKAGVEVEVLHKSTGREVIGHDMESDFIPANCVLILTPSGKKVPFPAEPFDALFEKTEEQKAEDQRLEQEKKWVEEDRLEDERRVAEGEPPLTAEERQKRTHGRRKTGAPLTKEQKLEQKKFDEATGEPDPTADPLGLLSGTPSEDLESHERKHRSR